MGHNNFDSEASDYSPSLLDPHNLLALIEAQENYNMGVISVALPEGFALSSGGPFFHP
jgi:hypothetical protein